MEGIGTRGGGIRAPPPDDGGGGTDGGVDARVGHAVGSRGRGVGGCRSRDDAPVQHFRRGLGYRGRGRLSQHGAAVHRRGRRRGRGQRRRDGRHLGIRRIGVIRRRRRQRRRRLLRQAGQLSPPSLPRRYAPPLLLPRLVGQLARTLHPRVPLPNPRGVRSQRPPHCPPSVPAPPLRAVGGALLPLSIVLRIIVEPRRVLVLRDIHAVHIGHVRVHRGVQSIEGAAEAERDHAASVRDVGLQRKEVGRVQERRDCVRRCGQPVFARRRRPERYGAGENGREQEATARSRGRTARSRRLPPAGGRHGCGRRGGPHGGIRPADEGERGVDSGGSGHWRWKFERG
mmetsp:Transcript_55153/g.165220  ORF Transcript_55153/g.165220 Transcript_55153/m.165220 type:complete len:342 (-) Transcript_55153:7763-8788(-)